MIETNLKILKVGRDMDHAISHFYGMTRSQLKNINYQRLDVFEVKEDNFDKVMEKQETYSQDDETKKALNHKMKQRRLVCVEIDW